MAKVKHKKKNGKSKASVILGTLWGVGSRVVIYIALVVALYYVARIAYRFGYSVFSEDTVEAAPGTDVLVSIEEDMNDNQITELMSKKGLIKDKRVFKISLKLYTGSRFQILPGTYTLNTSMTPRELIEAMCGTPEEPETTEPHLFEETGGN